LPDAVGYEVATVTPVALNVTGVVNVVEIIDALGNEKVEGVIEVGTHLIGPAKAGAKASVLVPGGVEKKKLAQSLAPAAVMVPVPLIFISTGVGVPPAHGLSTALKLTVSDPAVPPFVSPGENFITPVQCALQCVMPTPGGS
jgi:hypothetical protein